MTESALSGLDELLRNVPSRPLPTYDEINYETLLRDHLLPNRPLILSSRHTADWPCRRDWALPPSPALLGSAIDSHCTTSTSISATSSGTTATLHRRSSSPNLAALRRYAHHVVPVADTSRRLFSEFERSDRPLGQVLDLWETGRGRTLYVKDWHLLAELEREGRGVAEVYTVPEVFGGESLSLSSLLCALGAVLVSDLVYDWLNPPYTPGPRSSYPPSTASPSGTGPSVLAAAPDDFRFAYLGPKGTYTPLHRDVYASYSWSANIVGRKLWWFFPPGEALDAVRNERGEPMFDVREVCGGRVGIRVLQGEGEVVFVPSGWWHQVINVDFCISINHNFFASPALPRILPALVESQNRVEASIADVRDMIQQRLGIDTPEAQREWADEVQALLERDQGWNWAAFLRIVIDNLQHPGCEESLRPPATLVRQLIRPVLDTVRSRGEMVIPEVRWLAQDVEGLLLAVDQEPQPEQAP